MDGDGSFRLGDWRVEPGADLLTRDEEEVKLEPKVMEVLRCLARHGRGVVSKRDLVDEVWQTEFVAENTLTRSIAELRRALGDDARDPTFIQTVPKKGYRLLLDAVPLDAPFDVTLDRMLDEIGEPEPPVFVARNPELARLDGFLDRALGERGAVAFIHGEAGTGKTALAGEFCRRAQERIGDLVVAVGYCNAATGAGDPYGPWRQVLAQLTGDLEAGAGPVMLGRQQAERLWSLSSHAGRVVAEVGIDLVETLIPGHALVRRMTRSAPAREPWVDALANQAEFRVAVPAAADIRQSALFEQAARVVRRLTAGRPLVLLIEDLHWIDSGSANLLFHLGRRIAGCRVLVIATYRPSEIALGRDGERHPADHVLHELKREHGDTAVDLPQTGGKDFVDAFIDAEPNRLDQAFRDAVYGRTSGHALFTVELLKAMQERGELLRDDDGRWVEGECLDWQSLPARVEGVLAQRIERLPDELLDLLSVAAVEGEEFTAEVVAEVRKTPVREVVRSLGRDLERRHNLVSSCGFRDLGNSRVARFRFGHSLFVDHLYGLLNDSERAFLHEDVGTSLEALSGDHTDRVAAELARHFEMAGRVDRAVQFLAIAAARATAVSAFSEAERLSRHALDLVEALPADPAVESAAIGHLRILLTATAARIGWARPEVRLIAEEVLGRCRRLGDEAGEGWTRFLLISHYGNRGDHRSLTPLLEQNLELARRSDDPLLLMATHLTHLYMIWAGEPARALEHLEKAAGMLDESAAESFFRINGYDCRPLLPMWMGIALTVLGHPERAAPKLEEAIGVADAIGNPFSRAVVRGISGPFMVWAGLPDGSALSEESVAIATDRGFDEIRLYGEFGQVIEAAANGDGGPNERYLATVEQTGYLQALPLCLVLRSQLRLAAGDPKGAITEIHRALDFVRQGGQGLFESTLHRVKGDAAIVLGDPDRAEGAYLRAIEIARRQKTTPFELDAATALARLRQGQGRSDEAADVLRQIVDRFSEGLDAGPIVEARALLNELEVGRPQATGLKVGT